MTSTNTQIISCSSPPPPSKSTHQFTYEVFLSFRGEDTRYGFTDHLYEALISCGIRTFRDDEELKRGGVIASELPNAIEESKIFVIIFSQNYATSRWCLDELVKIFECTASTPTTITDMREQRLILPVFYHVDPSDVRKQSGSYEEAFLDHEREADAEKKEKIRKWRMALTEAGNLAGYDLQKDRHEARLIKKIVDVILKELDSKLLLDVSKKLVGMDFHWEELKSLIEIESNDVRMIGIYGLGGIGKTTISKVVYNNIFHLFEGSIFLENVRKRFQDQLQLQKDLLNGVIKGRNQEINNIHEGTNVIKQKLCSKKVLIILDDVDNLKQLEYLAGEHGWFGPGSRIIITTRDQHLLRKHEVDAPYEVKELGNKESIKLFCQHAFKQDIPEKDYEDVSNDVVDYVKGLPLALEILGSSLFSQSKDVWECTLQKLRREPNMEVQKVLMISFDGLDKVEQRIFLDVVCFFRGCNENDVTRLLDNAKSVLSVLRDKCLITLSHNIIRMHDLVQEMGREIVRHDHPGEPGKWSRLWDLEDICPLLRRKTGTEAIEGIFLDMSKSREISFTTEAFKRMEKLRLFKVYWSRDFVNNKEKQYQKLLLPQDFEFPSYVLRYLHWEGYPLKSLPTKFEGDNLIELNLKHSNIKHLWQMDKCLKKLKVLNLSGSQQLIDMPHFSNMSNLEILNIEFCGSLDKVDSSIGCLKKLTSLNLSGCRKIRSLPSGICKLKSLEYLYLGGCSKLETFPEITKDMKCLKELDLSDTCIKELPSPIEYLHHLTHLSLKRCKNLWSLPSSICKLKSLEYLSLAGSYLVTFLEIMEDMECLKELNLSVTLVGELPSSIEYLNHLTSLSLDGCKNLRSLPSSICKLKSLKRLSLEGSNLETFPEIMEDMECLDELDLSVTLVGELPSSIEYLNHLTSLSLDECKNLRSLPSSICKLKSLKRLSLEGSNLETFPEIMEDMECLDELNLSETCVKELPSSIEYLNHLTSLSLDGCKNLRSLPSSICKLKSLKRLSLIGLNLETFPEIMEDMECLDELDLSVTLVGELPSPIEYLNHLTSLSLDWCINLRSLPSSICKLKSLKGLSLEGSNLETFPEIMEDMECLKGLNLSVTLVGELPSSIEYLNHLMSLSLDGCKNLRSLPSSICKLKSLESLSLKGSNLETFPEIMEDMECLDELDLSVTLVGELPSSIEYLNHLTSLSLDRCINLRSLPSSICKLKSLKSLSLKGSNLETFPEIMEDMECLDELDLSVTLVGELPSSIEYLNHLTSLSLDGCKNLRSLPSSICKLKSLKRLSLKGSNLETFPEIMEDMECLDELDLSGTCVKELPSSIEYLNHLTSLSLDGCKNLRSLPSSICKLKSLKRLSLAGLNLETFSEIKEDMECLDELDLSVTLVGELPSSIEYLNHLTSLSLDGYKNLRSLPSSICKLKSLKRLSLKGSNLETFPEIKEDMECLDELDLSVTLVGELPSSIEYLNHLTSLSLDGCKNLRSLPSSICKLKSLKRLSLKGSNLETFPKIMEDMECLDELDLSGTCVKELPSSIEYLNHLTSLSLDECKNLRSLPSSICKLKSLKRLSLEGSNLETFPEIMEDMECLDELDLSVTLVGELPSSIEYLNHLTSLSLDGCKSLRSLPSSICKLKSLKRLSLEGSNLETFPEIMEDMECLDELDLSVTLVGELPSSIEYLNHLTSLSLDGCKNLRSLPSSICKLKSLKRLSLEGSNLETFPEIMEEMERLEKLDLRDCKNLRSLPSSIGRLKLLKELYLSGCPNLVIEDMESLTNLGLSETQNLMGGVIPSDLWRLSSLVKLDLCQNDMHHIPAAIAQLCNLECLNISHCKKLEEIPELPSTLTEINAHDCPRLGSLSNPSTLLWSSLLKWLKKAEPPLEWRIINLGSNGIPGWVRHQKMGSRIRIEIPMDWDEDDHFLGFGFFIICTQKIGLHCSLKFDGEEYIWHRENNFFSHCRYTYYGSESDEVWLLYCPKTAIQDKLRSNQYMHLEASFHIGTYGGDNINSCGVHLIYSQDDQQNHISLLEFAENSGDNKSTAKDIKRSHDDAALNQAEEPYRKRLRESNTYLKL